MIVIDTNALVVLIIGMIDIRLFKTHKTTSIYDEDDYHSLIEFIGDFENLSVLPNVWTELDNLLNGFQGRYKEEYVKYLKTVLSDSTENYYPTELSTVMVSFYDLGITDSLVLEASLHCDYLITADSGLSDYAKANDILVYDLIEEKNLKLRSKL